MVFPPVQSPAHRNKSALKFRLLNVQGQHKEFSTGWRKYFQILGVPAKMKPMFGENLKRIRAKRGLTQRELAQLALIHKRYVQDLEACLKIPSVVIAIRLQRAWDCEWEDLAKGL